MTRLCKVVVSREILNYLPNSKDTNSPELEFTVSNRTILRVIAASVAAIILFGAIKRSSHTLELIGVALFLSLALNAPVHWLAEHLPGKRRGNRGLATGLSIVIVLV